MLYTLLFRLACLYQPFHLAIQVTKEFEWLRISLSERESLLLATINKLPNILLSAAIDSVFDFELTIFFTLRSAKDFSFNFLMGS